MQRCRGLSHDSSDTFFQSWPIRGEIDMNSDLPTLEMIWIPDLVDVFLNPLFAGQIPGNVNIPYIHQFFCACIPISSIIILHILHLARMASIRRTAIRLMPAEVVMMFLPYLPRSPAGPLPGLGILQAAVSFAAT